LEGFPGQLGGQRLQALAGGHIAALADEGAPPGGLAPVVQAKDGGQINPMPAFDLLALLPQGVGTIPVQASAIPAPIVVKRRVGRRTFFILLVTLLFMFFIFWCLFIPYGNTSV
jgi:hypothetical protein